MPGQSIIDRMNEAPLVFDGAMGTMLYERGVFLNRCFDELCLVKPDLVREIHGAYVEAGADVIETNTFGANRVLLRGFGLAEQAAEINRRGAALAREAAGDSVYVGGSVGPCLRAGQDLAEHGLATARQAFEECTAALAGGGVDFILLETFSHTGELLLAAAAAARTGLPVLASFAVDCHGETGRGTPLEDVVAALAASGDVDALGMNCGLGPAEMHSVAERALALTRKPFVLMPNAGRPQQVEGRMLYLATPEYFTTYARRFIKLGARGVGGCCGTTPRHIRDAARAIHALSGVKRHIEIKVFEPRDLEIESVPTERKSHLGAKLSRGERVTSVELLPPRSCDLSAMLDKARTCFEAGIDAINVPDGPRASARVSPMIASMAIRQQVGIEPILHYCCRDRNLIGMQSDLLGGHAAGVRNFLIITGDPPKIGDYPDVTGVFDVDAIGLTRVAANLNRGRDIGGNPIAPPPGILIGVGLNPCAVEPGREQERFRRKAEAGAEFAITQPVFDADALLRFLDETSQAARDIPIVAGVWPLVSFKNAEFMNNEVPGVEVPHGVLERMRACRTKEDGRHAGIAIAREICDRIAPRVAGFQVSAPFGNVSLALDVLA